MAGVGLGLMILDDWTAQGVQAQQRQRGLHVSRFSFRLQRASLLCSAQDVYTVFFQCSGLPKHGIFGNYCSDT